MEKILIDKPVQKAGSGCGERGRLGSQLLHLRSRRGCKALLPQEQLASENHVE